MTPSRPIDLLLSPFRRLAHDAVGSSLVLLAATALALACANSPLAAQYADVWERPFRLAAGEQALVLTLRDWVNDLLMALFFLVVGLEIKRELLVGSLASARAAALPVAAAVGGMLVPALLFLGVNAGTSTARGWGIPMATDIAFALGLLGLLAPTAPAGLRAFLAALAIVDDLGAILVIAVAYAGSLHLGALAWAGACLTALVGLNLAGVRRPAPYLLLGVPLWLAIHASGIHATLAGVLLALTIPTRRGDWPLAKLLAARDGIDAIEAECAVEPLEAGDEAQQAVVEGLRDAYEAVQPPSQQIERALHGWVALAILPLFAFANAGVPLSGNGLAVLTTPPALGVLLGLVLGKPLGICAFAWLAVRAFGAELPAGVRPRQLLAAGCLGGIGFTMAIFIAGLAFPGDATQDATKLAILAASALAAGLGALLLRTVPAPPAQS